MAYEIGSGKGNDAGLVPPTKTFEGRLFAGATVMDVAVGFRSIPFKGKAGMGLIFFLV